MIADSVTAAPSALSGLVTGARNVEALRVPGTSRFLLAFPRDASLSRSGRGSETGTETDAKRAPGAQLADFTKPQNKAPPLPATSLLTWVMRSVPAAYARLASPL